jgi:hypothetical protein
MANSNTSDLLHAMAQLARDKVRIALDAQAARNLQGQYVPKSQ